MNSKKIKLYFFILSSVFLPSVSYSRVDRNETEHLIEYSLSITKLSTYFDFQPGNTAETKMEQIGIDWYESFSSYFHAGLEVGYIDMSQIDNSSTSAQFTSGQYAGIKFRFLPVDSPLISLSLNFDYRYNKTQGKNSVQESQFIWSESTLATELHFQPNSDIGLFIASDYQFLDGSQQTTGNINLSRSFKGSKSQGFRVGSKLSINRNGEIRVQWATGFRNSVEIHFTRTF